MGVDLGLDVDAVYADAGLARVAEFGGDAAVYGSGDVGVVYLVDVVSRNCFNL